MQQTTIPQPSLSDQPQPHHQIREPWYKREVTPGGRVRYIEQPPLSSPGGDPMPGVWLVEEKPGRKSQRHLFLADVPDPVERARWYLARDAMAKRLRKLLDEHSERLVCDGQSTLGSSYEIVGELIEAAIESEGD